MSSSQLAGPEADSIAKSRKRRTPLPPPPPSSSQSRKPFVRPRKKRKRLDAIRDRVLEPVQAPAEAPEPADTDALRRSSRVRRPKIVTNSSSSHSPDRKRKRRFNRSTAKTNRNDEVRFDASKGDRRVRHSSVGDLEETGDWGVRLRSRARNVTVSPQKVKGRNKMMEALAVCKEEPKLLKLKKTSKVKVSDKSGDQISLSSIKKEESNQITVNESLSDSPNKAPSPMNNSINGTGEEEQIIAVDLEPMMPTSIVEVEAAEENGQRGQPENGNCIVAVGNNAEDDRHAGEGFLEDAKNKKSDEVNSVLNDASIVRTRIKEGRRCGLCGGGTDGKPPKKLARDCGDSDNEVYGGSSASEDPNYDSWDGFDDEPDWLGPLLGPIHDRFGIAGVWVHRHCAVWSPEVYFADLGCLKNVRAALCRGRALKCSRCGRPGATIGCRVDRCPKTYHLPCARAEHSIFDHRKFLIACADHRHLFQPHGYHYLRRIKRLKAKKMRWEFRKLSHDASRKDLEAEEMWLENCGEDEEFLKREGRRLHRDLSRVKPVYIGGDSSCKSDDLYQGFESVAGLQGVIQCMKEVVILPLLYPEFFSSIGLTPPRGVLLHGYPGTGKTLVVRALIGACSRGDKRIAYFARKGADCLGKYVGDAERQLRLLFQVAEKSQPSIIFFDEIDGLAPCRSKQQDQTHSSVVSTLLALLDGLKSRGSVIVIGATNRPDAVDPALRRPGRFDREIYFPLPSVKDRSAILSLHTQRWPKPVSGSFLSWIAEQTAGFAGADLQALCTQAAMLALKRNCALQELLSAAERHPSHGRRLSLPSFVVEEQDWLAALACAPPPCSRREAGSCANDVVSSPLHSHLTPCLMRPIAHLLISLYLDERISLSPHIYKIAKLMKDLIYSALEQKKLPFASWITHLHHLIQEPCFAKDVEKKLAQSGLLTGASVFPNSESSYHGNVDHENSDSRFCGYGSTGALMGRGGMMNFFSGSSGATSGFRVLIAGSPRCGQRHVAACLLHGFVGHIEVQKINLATISQEGRGDMVQGITHILLKCFSVGRCIIYMPRIDLWAMDKTHDEAAWNEEKLSTEAWNSFIEQVDSMSASASFIILATCETPNSFLPHRISQFFTCNVSNFTGPSPPEHTIPRFLMQLDGKFNRELVFDLSAENIARDLIKQYVQLVHCRTHVADKFKIRETMKVNSEGKTLEMDSGTANGVTDGSSVLKSGGTLDEEVGTQPHQDSVARIPPKRNAKGKSNLLYSIATFGYQILRYPHFAELCWATSKLKDGPCTGVNGPWKAWPFNSCFIFPNNLMEKKAIGGRNRENSVVRGLVAVGLLAYKGFYTSVREVSLEVRRVLELFVEHINIKILGGKDRYQFLRLLSQVAYLEDMVNSWAYSLQSLELECQVSSSNWRPTNVGRLDSIDNHAYSGGAVKNDEILPTISDDNKKEVISLVSEENLVRVSPEKGESGKSNKEDAHLGLNNLDEAILSPKVDGVISGLQVDAFQDMVSLSPTSNALFKNGGNGNANKEASCPDMSASGRGVLGPGIEIYPEMVPVAFSCPPLLQKLELASGSFCIEHPPCSSENHGSHNGGLGSPILSNGSVVVESKVNCHSVRNIVSPLEENGCNANKPIGDSNTNFTPENNDTSISETLCVYSCCCECMHKIRGLVREIISGNWESNGCGSTVEDVHDVVETCSVSLLATIKKSFVSKSCTNSGDLGGTRDKHCCCQKVGDTHLKKISLSEGSENIGVMPMECICHSSTRNSRSDGPRLRFFYRDCRLVSSDPDKGASFHCKFESLCACATIEKILMIREPLD